MRNRNILVISMIIATFCAVLFGCGAVKNGQSAGDVSAADENTVIIQDYKFQPAEITIRKGETITWVNRDSVAHTITGENFDSGRLSTGQSFKQTFSEGGNFDYRCKPHPYMTGKIVVQ